jgi:hypothetical protein
MGEQKRLPVNLTELADIAIVSHAKRWLPA